MTKQTTILVAEDFPATFALLDSIFARCGIKVVQATTAEEVVEMAVAEQPDLIVMDVLLTRGSGLEAAKVLKATPETTEIPIIAMSGGLTPWQLRDESRAAGCQDYLAKPFKMADLAWRIHRWLRPVEAAV